MGMNWIIFALIPPFLWAFVNVLNKIIRTKHIDSTAAYFIIASFFQITCVIALFFVWDQVPISLVIVYAMLIGMMQGLGGFLYFEALDMEEVSRVIPLARFESIFVILFATVLLHEILTSAKYVGFFLILTGGFIIALKELKGVFHLSKAFFLMMGASFLWGTSDVLLKQLSGSTNYLPLFFLNRTGALLFAILLLIIPHFRRDVVTHFKQLTKSSGVLIVISESLALIGLLVFFYAFSQAPISLVNVLLGFQPLFVLIIASIVSYKLPHILDEQLTKKVIGLKIFGILLLIVGLILIENGIH